MKKHFVWIIGVETTAQMKKRGVSSSYIIPASIIQGFEKDIANGFIWLVVRGKFDTLSAILVPKKIERFKDGFNRGDFLLHIDLLSSFRMTANYNLDTNLSALKNLPSGLSEISTQLSQQLFNLTRSSLQFKLIKPVISDTADLIYHSGTKVKRLARTGISEVVQHYNLDELWGSGIGAKLQPIANFAYTLIKSKVPNVDDSLINILRDIDPLKSIKELEVNDAQIIKESSTSQQKVDLEFTEINPETIYAREFISASETVNIEEALAKTEVAEALHQDMLRDISQYLKSRNIIPNETTSIDLMIDHSGMKIFEIKSTNENNIYAQSSKGAFQLAYYRNAIKEDYEEVDFALIIHKTANQVAELTCIDTLNILGVKCLVYNPSIEWPERIPGFLVIP